MPDRQAQLHPDYLDTLLQYYEEEIAGEAYFYGLAEHFPEREKTRLLARVERAAALSVAPLLERHGLAARDEAYLQAEGREQVQRHASWDWHRFMTYIVARYPRYLDEFAALEAMAPVEDRAALNRLTRHEVLVIEFAERELAGDSQSIKPLFDYLDSVASVKPAG